MPLRNRSPRSAFFVGTRRTQSELVEIALAPLTDRQCAFLAQELARHDCLTGKPAGQPPARFCCLVADAHQTLLSQARFFFPEPCELIGIRADGAAATIAVPAIPLATGVSDWLLLELARCCLQAAQATEPIDRSIATLRQQLDKIVRAAPNVFQFARAAFELGLPVLEWQSGHLQVGWGRNSAVLKGSLNHRTPGIGIAVARHKAQCNALLAQAGFPIAKGSLVGDLAGARRQAARLGFPVVVKPDDLDGGQGVSSDVRTAEELDQAYAVARTASANVIVEKHIAGKDYRLLLFEGRLLTAIERTPGAVTGDGIDSIAALIDRLNGDPRRGPGPDTPLYTLEPDGEAELMARRQGFSMDGVPAEGQIVQLRRAANFALGGNVAPVDEIHPDNLDLALRAMRLLRLDLAGLDLILPDIARSWHETGGAICEVNAQPFIGEPIRNDYHKLILHTIVPADGRIPVVLVVGKPDAAAIAAITARVPQLAVVDSSGARLDGHPLSPPHLPWPIACQAPLFDPTVAAVLCILDPAGPIPSRSPVDRFSAAFAIDSAGSETDDLPEPLLALLRRAGAERHPYTAEAVIAALTGNGPPANGRPN
jgi:cyanophycin synthetase